MDSNQSFYDILQLPRDATPDQIRKAYKKQALLTHPDRLPAGFTPSEKRAAEEQFRNVSNAYEVLKDPENRRLYDTHGVWPPPQPQEQPYPSRPQYRSGHRYEPFAPDPFENFFTEPFDLFDKMFSDYRRPSYHPVHRSSSDWQRDPFEAIYRIQDMMADLERDMFAFPSPFTRSHSIGFEPPAFGTRAPPIRWAQESTMLTSRNGVTHRIHKRRDWDGNEHVTRTYPDGREIYTINGVEQERSPRGYLPPPGPPPAPQDPRNMPPAPPQMNNARGYISPPPSYHSSRSSVHSGPTGRHSVHSVYSNRGEHPIFYPFF
ncbi:hypothetical protein DFH07DRAFT_748127 [Mycena maculata]|uniref:J domain-containing protein n=1 Tax=Mycena maculata TaxID=230809 RepID=A0AAD7N6T8_9AGAR|nr:hypothetical protein DFH07DRAFT_748127 [Mycena maculata]